MLDIKLIRENPEMVRENLKKRQNPEIIERLDSVIKLTKNGETLYKNSTIPEKEKMKLQLR